MSFDVLGSLNPQQPASAAIQPQASVEPAQCSRRGCAAPAQWQLLWNNPRIHTPNRRKVWLACEQHREHLSQFLEQRSFLKDIKPFVAGAHDAAATHATTPREDH